MSTFGERLKALRNNKALTQDELAKAIKISKSSINMYERGEREPKFETLEVIADFFNVDMDYLLGRSDKTIRYSNLIEIYLSGIMFWSEDKLAKPHDTEVYRMHFAELLLRYKQLIERAVYTNLSVDKYLESVEEFNVSRNEPMTTEQLKEQYFKAELQKELDSLTHWINAFPFHLSRSEESPATK